MKHVKPLQIAIDGPSCAGKSTYAKALAQRLGLLYLDTGAMYRALAYKALASGYDPSDAGVAALLPDTVMDVQHVDGIQRVLLDGVDVTERLRTLEISTGASQISAHAEVRAWTVALQQDIARRIDVVMDGRDIGTVVLPDAPYKFFVTASVDERAKRRLIELQANGQAVTFEQVRANIAERDQRDTERVNSPLKQANDAILIDTTSLSIDGVLDAIMAHINV